MKKFLNIFHYISFISVPFLLLAIFYAYKPLIFGMDNLWFDFNYCLTFMGIGLSFTSLADTKKKNKLSRKLYGNPKFARGFLIYAFSLFLLIFGFGLYALLISRNENLNELSIGIIILSIGYLGVFRMAIEMVRNHLETSVV